MDRRSFIAGGAGIALLGGPFAGVAAAGTRATRVHGADYGPLAPVARPARRRGPPGTPEGLQLPVVQPRGQRLHPGRPAPGRHDGMAAFDGPRGTAILVRNHEVNGPVGAFGDVAMAYDPAVGGGCATLAVTRFGEVVSSGVSLNGTQMNCSGGPMPWGAWVTCEETVNGPDVGNDFTGADNTLLKQKHGYIFEVPLKRAASRTPIRKAGRFAHESAAFDPSSGAIYLTEDNFGFPSGFYRYLPPQHPARAGRILDGGRLQMLAVKRSPAKDLSVGLTTGTTWETTWVDIDDPDPTFTTKPTNDQAIQYVGNQGREKGAALFSRLEGAVYDAGTSTSSPPRAARPQRVTPLRRGSARAAARSSPTTLGRGGCGWSTSRRRRWRWTCPTTSPPAPRHPGALRGRRRRQLPARTHPARADLRLLPPGRHRLGRRIRGGLVRAGRSHPVRQRAVVPGPVVRRLGTMAQGRLLRSETALA